MEFLEEFLDLAIVGERLTLKQMLAPAGWERLEEAAVWEKDDVEIIQASVVELRQWGAVEERLRLKKTLSKPS